MSDRAPRVAIVDYDMGNLFSVWHACSRAGLDPLITNDPAKVAAADAIIVPGIGGFPDAMRTLERERLVGPILDAVGAGRPVLGICLGMQLLMDESDEFGRHKGLGVLPGTVERFPTEAEGRKWKVPQVGWNRLTLAKECAAGTWEAAALRDGDFMYFVHSYHVRPAEVDAVSATANYAGLDFCAAFSFGNVVGWQFHPERSGPRGLELYQTFAERVRDQVEV